MFGNNSLLLVIAVVVIIAVAVAAMVAKGIGGGASATYRPRAFLTPNELEFFNRLLRALPDHHVFPQVAMSALIEPTAKGKEWRSAFGRISQKRVDYCVFTKADMKLVAIVELDDRTHDSKKDAQRDSYTESAGIRTVRFHSKRKPTEPEIRKALQLS